MTNLSKSVTGFGTDLRINNLKIDHLKQDLSMLLKSKSITNAIVLGTDLTKKQVKFIANKIQNVVFLDTYFEDLNCDFVTMDNYRATYNAAEFIINKGISRIGYAALAKENANFLMRRAGFFSALEDHHITINKDNFYKINPSELSPIADLNGFSSKKLPEAIFCENDYLAIRIIKECSKLNIKIPEDIKIMGFDDINESQLLSPSLTTVHVPIDQIVNQVIFQLQGQVASSSWQAQKTLIGTKIVQRESL